MLFLHLNQIRIGADNFCYLIHSESKRAVVVDPGFDPGKIIDSINSNGLVLEYIILTHHHTDHSYGIKDLKKNYPKSKIIASIRNGNKIDSKIDITVFDGDVINIDELKMDIISTPGYIKQYSKKKKDTNLSSRILQCLPGNRQSK